MSQACVALGAFLILLGSLGLVRFPDVLTRMAAVCKTSTLGMLFVVVGVALRSPGLTGKLVLGIAFVWLGSPIAAHLIGRAAYRSGAVLSPRMRHDEMPQK